jgi:hypothetical protein
MSSRDMDDTDLPEYYRLKMRDPHPPGSREKPRRAPQALPSYYHTGTIISRPGETPREGSETHRSDHETP